MNGGVWQVLNSPVMTTGAILFSAAIALAAVWVARKTTRERETVALIFKFHWDNDYIRARNVFKRVRDSDTGLVACINGNNSKDQKDQTDYDAVLQIMNHYEMISVGINSGILSAEIYDRYYRTRFVKDWIEAKALIAEERRVADNDRLFVEFETLAKNWAEKYEI